MYASIKFIAGRRAPARYIYRDTDLFEPSVVSAPAEPLRLTDFKEVEVLSQNTSYFYIKCYFNDGTDATATVDVQMMYILHKFIYNMKDTPKGQQPEFPVDNTNPKVIALTAVVVFFICLILIIR